MLSARARRNQLEKHTSLKNKKIRTAERSGSSWCWTVRRSDYFPWQQLAHEPSVQHFAQPFGQQLPLHAALRVAAWPNATTENTSINERKAIVRFMDISLDVKVRFTNHAKRD
jgi:hypothetical protein